MPSSWQCFCWYVGCEVYRAAAIPEPAVTLVQELVLKLVAAGWKEYIHDKWNQLDFVCVMTAVLDVIPDLNSSFFGLFRALRVLRVLRTLRWFNGLALVLHSLVGGSTYLLQVFVVFLTFCILAGIVGIEEFGGALRRRCHTTEGGVDVLLQLPDPEPPAFCMMPADGMGSFGLDCEDLGVAVGSTSFCASVPTNSIAEGTLHFDHIGVALLSILQVGSLEGWTSVAYWLHDATGPWAVVFVVLVVAGVNWLVFNIFISVICGLFATTWAQYEREVTKQTNLLHLQHAAAESRALLKAEESSAPAPSVAAVPAQAKPALAAERAHSAPSLAGKGSAGLTKARSLVHMATAFASTRKGVGNEDAALGERSASSNRPVWHVHVVLAAVRMLRVPQHHLILDSLRHCCWLPVSRFMARWQKQSMVFDLATCVALMALACLLVVQASVPLEAADLRLSLLCLRLVLCCGLAVEVVLRNIQDGFKHWTSVTAGGESLLTFVSLVATFGALSEFPKEPGTLLLAGQSLVALRLVRTIRLAEVLRPVQRVLALIRGAGDAMILVVAVNIFVISMCALLGMQLFSSQAEEPSVAATDDAISRLRFNSFPNSILTLFVVASGEAWTVIMQGAFRDFGSPGMLFIMLFYLLAELVLLPLLVANIVTSLSAADEDRRINQGVEFVRLWKRERHKKITFLKSLRSSPGPTASNQAAGAASPAVAPVQLLPPPLPPLGRGHDDSRSQSESTYHDSALLETTSLPSAVLQPDPLSNKMNREAFDVSLQAFQDMVRSRFRRIAQRIVTLRRLGGLVAFARSLPRRKAAQQGSSVLAPAVPAQARQGFSDDPHTRNINQLPWPHFRWEQAKRVVTELWWKLRLLARAHEGYTLGCLRPDGFFASSARRLEESLAFKGGMLLVVIALVVCASQGAHALNSSTELTLAWVEAALSVMFVLELAVHAAARGLLFTDNPCSADGWLRLEMAATVANVLSAAATLHRLKTQEPAIVVRHVDSVLRCLRLLRVLTVLKRVPPAVNLLATIKRAGHELIAGFAMLAVVVLSFAVVGNFTFAHGLGRCSDDQLTSKQACEALHGANLTDMSSAAWVVPESNFDTLAASAVTLIEVATLEGYVEVMLRCMDMSGRYLGPKRDASAFTAVFFMLYIVVVAYVLLQFLVAIVLVSSRDTAALLTKQQREYHNVLAYSQVMAPKVDVEHALIQQKQLASGVLAARESMPSQECGSSRHSTPAVESVRSKHLAPIRLQGQPIPPPPQGQQSSDNQSTAAPHLDSLAAALIEFSHHSRDTPHAPGPTSTPPPAPRARPDFACRVCRLSQVLDWVFAVWQAARRVARDLAVPCGKDAEQCESQGRQLHWAHSNFERASWFVSVLNTVLLLSYHTPLNRDWEPFWEWGRAACLTWICAEVALQLLGLGWARFCASKWNLYDLCVCVLCVCLAGIPTAYLDTARRLGRMLLGARAIRVAMLSPGVYVLFNTLAISIKQISGVAFVLGIFIALYALVGMELFGHIGPEARETASASPFYAWLRRSPPIGDTATANASLGQHTLEISQALSANSSSPFNAMGRHVNFQTFGVALLTMLRVATGEDWPSLLHDIRRFHPVAGPCFFLTFVVFCGQLLVQFFLSFVIMRFERCWSLVRGQVTFSDLQRFKALWRQQHFAGGAHALHLQFSRTRAFLEAFALTRDARAQAIARGIHEFGEHSMGSGTSSSLPGSAVKLAAVASDMARTKIASLSPETDEEVGHALHFAALEQDTTSHPQLCERMRSSRSAFGGNQPDGRQAAPRRSSILGQGVQAVAQSILSAVQGSALSMTELQAFVHVGLHSRLWWALLREELRDAAVLYTARAMVDSAEASMEADVHTVRRECVCACPSRLGWCQATDGGNLSRAESATGADDLATPSHTSWSFSSANGVSYGSSSALIRGELTSGGLAALRAGLPVKQAKSEPAGGLERCIHIARGLPDSALGIPFEAIVAIVCKWHFGPAVLLPRERLHASMDMKRWYQHVLVARVQSQWRRRLATQHVTVVRQRASQGHMSEMLRQACAARIQRTWRASRRRRGNTCAVISG